MPRPAPWYIDIAQETDSTGLHDMEMVKSLEPRYQEPSQYRRTAPTPDRTKGMA
jgi:hypothetical protein